MAKTEDTHRDRKWRELLRLVRETGNIRAACESAGVSRSAYYKWRRQQADGGAPARARHPQATSEAAERLILELARDYPAWGCDRIAYFLKLQGQRASSPTVQKILVRHGLGRKSQRRNPR